MILSYKQAIFKILYCFVICVAALCFVSCVNVMQDVFKGSSNYTLKYAHVQNDKIFLEEVKEIAKSLPYKSTFSSSLNDLQELSDSYKLKKIPDEKITFTCAFNKQYDVTLQTLLTTRKYPCDNEQAGYTLHSFTKNPYKDYYGNKFENIQNKEQFLLRYTKDFNAIQTKEALQETINSMITQIDSNDNIVYDLRELKHYAFMQGIIPTYEAFYKLLESYEVKCKGSLFNTTLDKVIMQQNLQCKKIKYVKTIG